MKADALARARKRLIILTVALAFVSGLGVGYWVRWFTTPTIIIRTVYSFGMPGVVPHAPPPVPDEHL